jgi:biotin synthase-like enzyme
MQQAVYNPSKFVHVKDITLSKETLELLDQATQIYNQNFNKKTWYGRCIFLSWYCSIGDCTFCFRTTQKHKIHHPKGSKRSMGSVLLEALFSRLFNWRIEFLTGGYGMMPFDELKEFAKNVSQVYNEKIWLNIGILTNEQLEQLRPYVKGIVSSMETLHPQIHKKVCPSKPIEPYDKMFKNLKDFKKSICLIVGLGDTYDDMKYAYEFIEKHNINRVTIYALKPIRDGPFKEGPSVEEYVNWIARLRIKFPKLEIIAGTNLRRSEEVGYLMKAGANAITKFPATKQFATKKAHLLTNLITNEQRIFTSNLTDLKDINFEQEINKLSIDQPYKDQMLEKLPLYLKTFLNPKDKDKDTSSPQG